MERPAAAALLAAALALTAPAAADEVDRWQQLSEQGIAAAEEGQLDQALQRMRAASELALAMPAGDPRRATSLNNLGFVHLARGEAVDALPLLQEAVRIRRELLGREHPVTAQALNNLGEAQRLSGRRAEAEATQREALAIRQARLGERHPEVAQSLNNLAVVLAELRRDDEARDLYRQALAIRSDQLGAGHPLVAESETNLGTLEMTAGRPAEAVNHLHRAVEIMERQSKPGPTLRAALTSLGTAMVRNRQSGDAVAVLGRAIVVDDGLPPGHPLALAASRALADAHAAAGDQLRATAVLSEALATHEQVVGPRSPQLVPDLVALAAARERGDDIEAARTLLTRALTLAEAGGSDGEVPTLLNNLAVIEVKLGAFAAADTHLVRALELARRRLGPTHPDIATTLDNHAAVLAELGRRDEAMRAADRARAIRAGPGARG